MRKMKLGSKKNKATKKQLRRIIQEVWGAITEWFSWDENQALVLSIIALLISSISAILSISRLIQYLISNTYAHTHTLKTNELFSVHSYESSKYV